MKKVRAKLGRGLCIAAALSLSSPAMAQLPTAEGSSASDAELNEARGGIFWYYYAVVGATAVLKTCTRINCVRLGVTAFTSSSAARRYICQRNRRLRIC